jgi:SAM-dependent methyltransferase/uncharacterized protein YbaR (Trm112 family)
MLRAAIKEQRLFCPSCRGVVDGVYRDAPLVLGEVAAEDAVGGVLHGLLACGSCPQRYPVVDGIPLVFKDVPDFVERMLGSLFEREDLPASLQQFLLSGLSDEHAAAWRRQMLAIYGATLESPAAPDEAEGSFKTALRETIASTQAFLKERREAVLPASEEAPWVLDAGCGVGASSLDWAARGARVFALDHELGPLRLLSTLLRQGQASVPRWRHGSNDYLSHVLRNPGAKGAAVLPIAGDALGPPLGAGGLRVASAFNLLDNVDQPLVLIRQLHALLEPGGTLVLMTPYDFVSRCTPPEHRLGEGIRVGDDPDPAAALRALLTGGFPELAPEVCFEITHERESLPWVLPRHKRSTHVFHAHYIEARKASS